jgi:hypothetical protein
MRTGVENPAAPERISTGCAAGGTGVENPPRGAGFSTGCAGSERRRGRLAGVQGPGSQGWGSARQRKSACPLASGVLICKHKLQDSDTPSEIQERR